MSWEYFVLGLQTLQHEEGRAFLTQARAARVAQAEQKDYDAIVSAEETVLGLR